MSDVVIITQIFAVYNGFRKKKILKFFYGNIERGPACSEPPGKLQLVENRFSPFKGADMAENILQDFAGLGGILSYPVRCMGI